MWVACVDCGKERLVQMTHGKPLYKRCKKCGSSFSSKRTRELSPHWKGGRRILRNGYIDILVAPTDFFFPMINKRGVVREHRLIMAKSLGRNLQRWELVHHKNGIRGDNRLENLALTTNGSHITEHNRGYQDGYAQGLKDGKLKQIQQLREWLKN